VLKNSLTILFALCTLLPAQSERFVIAITDVSAEGLSNIEIKMFYNRLESELVNLGQYDVTSRQEVDKILKEQKFQQAGCTDQECAAEIGRMLNADLILLPSILYDSRSGVVSVSLKLVDVESARITTAITKDAEVQRAIDVNVLIRDYLVYLYRRDREEKGIIVTPTREEKAVGKGRLIIKSIPIGANVILDNIDMGLTPLELDDIDEGKHRLVLSYKGYERYARSTTVTADVTNTIEGELVLLTGNLSIISEPPGSEVFVNDEYKGKTPLTLQHLEIGEYFVKLEADGYEDALTKVVVEWDKENILKKILSPKPASVAFYSVPDSADVFIDNRSRGKTSITGLKLELVGGKHKVKMELKGYSPETAEIELVPGETKDLELSLSKLPRGVSDDPTVGWVSIKGWPEDAALIFRGKRLSIPLKYYELKRGKYQGKVSKKSYRSETLSVTVVPQKHHEIEFQLKPLDRNKARRLAWLFPGLGHFYAEKKFKGMTWAIVEIASLYGIYTLFNEYTQKADEYNIVRKAYLAATMESDIYAKRRVYEDAFKVRNNAMYTTIGAGTFSAVVWILNVKNINRSIPDVLSHPVSNISLEVNERGELEVQIGF